MRAHAHESIHAHTRPCTHISMCIYACTLTSAHRHPQICTVRAHTHIHDTAHAHKYHLYTGCVCVHVCAPASRHMGTPHTLCTCMYLPTYTKHSHTHTHAHNHTHRLCAHVCESVRTPHFCMSLRTPTRAPARMHTPTREHVPGAALSLPGCREVGFLPAHGGQLFPGFRLGSALACSPPLGLLCAPQGGPSLDHVSVCCGLLGTSHFSVPLSGAGLAHSSQ